MEKTLNIIQMKLLLGDCLDKLKELDDNSVDSIVTDPPYGLSFMGKKWDYDVPSQAIWEECMRVLKPGGHLLSFAGSRTYHRMAVRIEDAGFEIRDQIMWIYGSGFPKSQNISKMFDKKAGVEREIIGEYDPRSKFDGSNRSDREIGGQQVAPSKTSKLSITAPATDEAKKWNGWGTALKPAHEPIVMARKPFKGTVADNVLEWGTGGINIDDSRVGTDERTYDLKGGENLNKLSREGKGDSDDAKGMGAYGLGAKQISIGTKTVEGRFPANIIFDEEAGKILDEQSGISKSSGGSGDKSMGALGKNGKYGNYALDVKAANSGGLGDVGGASRFFYCPKTSKKDRDVDNIHPTVKPTDLMAYLVRLVTPKGGVVLDPFMGSGSTGKAAVREGMVFIGIERESDYFEIAKARIQNEIDNTSKQTKVEPEVISKFFQF